MPAMNQKLESLVHRNLIDVTAWGVEGSGGTVTSQDGLTIMISPSTLPFLNAVMRDGPDGDPGELLERARSLFFEQERGFVVYTWPGDPELAQATFGSGMSPVLDRYPEMVCRFPLDPLPGDVREVADEADAAAYWRICDQAYPSIGFPPDLFTDIFPRRLLLEHGRVWACLAYEHGDPAACASLWLTAGSSSSVGFIGWVAALPGTRGRGLAAACTVEATNKAFELGAEIVSLQASAMGEPVYRRLGYDELYAYRLMGAMPPEG